MAEGASVSPAAQAAAGPTFPWFRIAWFAALLLACYAPVLKRLVGDWYIDEDMGHGFFVPVVAAYIVWQKKDEILARAYRPNPLGFLVAAAGAALLLLSTMAVELTLMRGSFLVSLAGVVLALGGWPLIRQLALPLGLLVFMIPLPAVIYNQITFPLQLLASQVAESVLTLIGIPVLRDGNVLELTSGKLSVVEACSGIRSLMSLTFLSIVYGFFFESRLSTRVLLLLLTPPIAILVNAMRVTATGILSETNPELAKGLFHSLEGWVMFLLALAALVAAHHAIRFVSIRLASRRRSEARP